MKSVGLVKIHKSHYVPKLSQKTYSLPYIRFKRFTITNLYNNSYNITKNIEYFSEKKESTNKRKTNLSRTLVKDRRYDQGHCHDNIYKQFIENDCVC